MPQELKGRRVDVWRCQIDPMIPPAPANAFKVGIKNIAHAELTPAGVYVLTMKEKMEFMIPYANIQSIKLAPLEDDGSDNKGVDKKGK